MRTLTVEADSRRIPLPGPICQCERGFSPMRDSDGDLYCLRCGKPSEPVSVVVTEALPQAPKTIIEEAMDLEHRRKRELNRKNKKRWREQNAKKYLEYKRKRRERLKRESRSTHRP